MSLIGRIKGEGPSGFGWSTRAEEIVEGLVLSERTILITGCNSGIGFEMMRVLATRGATVYGSARTRKKAEDAVARVGNGAIPIVCELSDPSSILRCVNTVRSYGRTLDALICNAGIMALPELERVYGYEKQFFVNYVGHFILVMGLLDQLAEQGRVVMVSSDAHKYAPPGGVEFDNLEGEKNYHPWRAYGQSKLANILFARELARQFELQDSHRKALAVHPGPIDTNLYRHIPPALRIGWFLLRPFLKTIPQGAATPLWAAVHPDAEELNGQYLADCNLAQGTRMSGDMKLADRLWTETEGIVEEVLELNEPPAHHTPAL